MLKLLIYAGLLTLGAVAVVWLADHPGRVEIEWLRWRLETSVPVLMSALLLLAAGCYGGISLTHGLWRWPGRLRAARRLKQKHRGYQALSDGLAAAAGGHAQQAGRLARRAEKLLKDERLTTVLAAQTAQLNDDTLSQRRHFTTLSQHPKTALLGWRGLMALAIAEPDPDAAINAGLAARRLAPADAALAAQLFELLLRQDRLPEAQTLVIDAGRHKAWSRAEAAHRRALLLNERARQDEREGEFAEALQFAKQAVANDPGLSDAVLRLARLQAAAGLTRQAAATLDKGWRQRPLPALAAALLALRPDDSPLDRLRRLEKLAEHHHSDAWVTHWLLGEAALAARVWGLARTHLSQAAARPTATLLGLLARLEIGQYKDDAAAQRWLATPPLADAAWLCGACSGSSPDWHLICPHCAAIDRMAWKEP